MKKSSFAVLVVILVIVSCKKNDSPALSEKIQNIIADSVVKAFEGRGLVINRGNKPPKVEGIFRAEPLELLSPYSAQDGYKKGRVIEDYLFKIFDQVNDEAKLDYKNEYNTDNATGQGTFISGSGSKFTLFSQSTGTSNSINYKMVSIMSGEVAGTGIKDMQFAVVLTEKDGDDVNILMIPEGKGRIWFDNDKIADKKNAYDFSALLIGRGKISTAIFQSK